MQDVGLHRSVQKQLATGETARYVAHMFTRHHLAIPFIAAAGVALVVVSALAGADEWPTRISLGLAGAAVAGMATTEYRVLALTTKGLVLLRSSRVRRRATGVMRRLPKSTKVEPIGTNLVITEYNIDGVTYGVMRRHQEAMSLILEGQ